MEPGSPAVDIDCACNTKDMMLGVWALAHHGQHASGCADHEQRSVIDAWSSRNQGARWGAVMYVFMRFI